MAKIFVDIARRN